MVAKLALLLAIFYQNVPLVYEWCRLVAPDKCPGLRPIGIWEVLRQINGKTITKSVKSDLKVLNGDQKIYIVQKGGND